MRSVETVIVGGGQAGLAMSRSLHDRGREHVVLERGRIAERWRSERWDSLRLLTPNWMSRLPGHAYRGPDPDGFMTKTEVVEYLAGYARSFDAPVEQETTVLSVSRHGGRWRVDTSRGDWTARNVVIATGHSDRPRLPAFAGYLDPSIVQVTTTRYRGPEALPDGGVLVVGASATGAQLADEIHRSGRPVTLAVGRHNRLPREYRGRDIMWWLDRTGVLDRSVEELRDPAEGRHEPSLQLVGRRPGPAVDLGALQARGIRLVGRAESGEEQTVYLGRDLERHMAAADARLARLLARIDAYAEQHGLDRPPAEPVAPLVAPEGIPMRLDLAASGIRTVLWATGYRRAYPWLHAPVFDAGGDVLHRRGRAPLAGLYVIGMQFQTRRRSSFIDGVGFDAEEIATVICGRPSRRCAAA